MKEQRRFFVVQWHSGQSLAFVGPRGQLARTYEKAEKFNSEAQARDALNSQAWGVFAVPAEVVEVSKRWAPL